jgi:hypothetical protein
LSEREPGDARLGYAARVRSSFVGILTPLFVLSIGCAASGPGPDGSGGGGADGTGATGGGEGGGASGGSGSGGTSHGSGAIGAPCKTDADCTDPPAQCYTTLGGGPAPTIQFPGGFCSRPCDPSSGEPECGDVAGCATLSSAGGGTSATLVMCTPPCASDADCRAGEGYKCFQLLPGIGVCTPP